MVRRWARGVARGRGSVRGRRRRGRWWCSPALLGARGPPGGPKGPPRQVAQEQPGARCVLRVFFGIRRRRSKRRAVGRRPSSVRWTCDTCSGPGCVLRWDRRQAFPGFQDASLAAGGTLSHRSRTGLLLTAYHVLYVRQALLSATEQSQGEQKTVRWCRGRRDAFSWRMSQHPSGARAVFAREAPRFLLRRVEPVQRRRGRTAASVSHLKPAAAATAAADCFSSTGKPSTHSGVCVVKRKRRQTSAPSKCVVRGRTRWRARTKSLATSLLTKYTDYGRSRPQCA
ncbi:uncharacterized protein LOC110996256 isoform X4 [Pieris rapae]|uniref:uncharacterized protein LOC110996256 isoform X4 n=1 Tax=Pieris rapae TaxID=64459 RepID=UPI001E27F48D|nr:uncharacterized protein LOC110996256 isoform X4 [Pieris rapae]